MTETDLLILVICLCSIGVIYAINRVSDAIERVFELFDSFEEVELVDDNHPK